MHRLLDRGLEQLTAVIFKMGELAEQSLTLSMGALVRRKDASEAVRELSELLVMMTSEVEEKSFVLIAKYQPVASDLRIINSYIKIAYDFERYGRYAWDIAFIEKRLGGLSECPEWILNFLSDMGAKVMHTVNVSTNSLRSLDTELAKSVMETEQAVDDMYFQYLDRIVEEDSLSRCCIVSSLLAVRYLERIADHSTYIAESVVYIASGEKVALR